MRDKIWLIDMDGVLAEFQGALIEGIIGTNPELEERLNKPLLSHDFIEQYPDLEQLSDHVYLAQHFYRNLEPIPGAIKAMKEIEEMGISAFICTKPATKSEYSASEKVAWVKQYLGDYWVKRMVITKDKTLVHGAILIDDKPEIEGVIQPAWEHVLYDQSYNQNSTKRRITWENWKEVLLQNTTQNILPLYTTQSSD